MQSTGKSDIHYHWFDWIRFISAFMVVAIHARGGLWVAWIDLESTDKSIPIAIFYALTRAGTEWVLVFFVLSGYLVGGKVADKVMRDQFDVRSYARDRLTRIMVPLLPTLIWSGAVAFYIGRDATVLSFVGNIFGLQGVIVSAYGGNFPLWSLAYEIWFYVLAGAVACLPTTSGMLRITAIFLITITFAIFTRLDPVFLFAWLIGAATFSLGTRPALHYLGILGLLLAVLGYVFSQLTSATDSVDLTSWSAYTPSNSVATLILATGIALILPYVSRKTPPEGVMAKIERVGTTLATSSYTLYLTHYPVLYLWDHFMPYTYPAITLESIAIYVIRILSCMLFAWLLYLPFERQTHRIRQFFANR